MSGWSERDRMRAHFYREQGVLVPVDDSRELGESKGVILLACGDGNRFPELFSFHRELIHTQGGADCVHVITRNGGALRLSDKSMRRGILEDVREAIELKGITTISAYVHGPCGWAALRGYSFDKVMEHTERARSILVREFGGVPAFRVNMLCHLDGYRTAGTMTTRLFDSERWKNLQAMPA